jgi:anti-sigma B factor antagonist
MIELLLRGEQAVVRVGCAIDVAVAADLRVALAWALEHHRDVVVDLADTPTLDPAGLSVLIRAHRRARHNGGRLCLVAPSRFVLTALHTMHVDHVFPIFEDCPAALGWLRQDVRAGAAVEDLGVSAA